MAGTPASSISTGGGGATVVYDSGYIGAGVASFDVSAIPSSYDHLRLYMCGFSNRAGTAFDVAGMRFNNDSGSNYGYHDDVTGQVGNTTSIALTSIPSQTGGATANYIGHCIVFIPFYANTSVFKPCHSNGGAALTNAGTGINREFSFGEWRSTSAINRITVLPLSGTQWLANSRLVIWGVTGAP